MHGQALKSLLLVLLLALGIASCGSSEDNTASGISKARFIAQADAICKAADESQLPALAKAAKQGSGESPADRTAAMLAAGLEPIQSEAKEIASLDVPNGDEDEVATIVEGIESAVRKVEAEGTNGDTAFVTVNRLAAQYGLKACSEVQ